MIFCSKSSESGQNKVEFGTSACKKGSLCIIVGYNMAS
jgi:hypothetical protein